MSFLVLLPLTTQFCYVQKHTLFFFSLCHLDGWMDCTNITDLLTQLKKINNSSAHFFYTLASKYCISRPMSCTTTCLWKGLCSLGAIKAVRANIHLQVRPKERNKFHLQCLPCKANVSTPQLAGEAQEQIFQLVSSELTEKPTGS